MQDIAQLGLAIDSSQAKTGTSELDRLTAAATKAERAALGLASGATRAAASEAQLANAARQAEAAMTRTGTAMGGATQHATNLMFQFQDIGMMLASGQNPLMLMMQQGTQVAGVFSQAGTRSVGGALTMLRGAFAQLLNPVSLLSMGFVGLAAVAGSWIVGLFNRSDEVQAILEQHEDTVREITGAYGEGADAAARFSRVTATQGLIMARLDMDRLTDSIGDAHEALSRMFDYVLTTANVPLAVSTELSANYGAFRASVQAGNPDFAQLATNLGNLLLTTEDMPDAFRNAVMNIYQAATAGQKLGGDLAETQAIVAALEAGVKNLDEALNGLGASLGTAGDAVKASLQNAEAMLGDMIRAAGGEMRLALDTTEIERQASYMRKVFEQTLSGDELTAALETLDTVVAARLTGINERFTGTGRAAGEAADRIQETIDGLYEQAAAAGLAGRELAHHEALVSAGIDANHAMADAVIAAADALYDQEAAAKAAEEAQDALLKKQEELLDAAENLGNSAWSAMMSIADGSKTAKEAVADLIKQLLLAEAKAMFLRAFNPTAPMGPIMTLLSSIGARANGGPVDAGRPYLVGERGPEMIIPRSAGTVVANENLGGGSVSLTVHVEGARGNAEIEEMVERGTLAALREYDKGASRRTINSVRMARSRGVRGV